MKYFLLFSLFSFQLFAETPGHWMSSRGIDENKGMIYTYQSDCTRVEKDTCENLDRGNGVILKRRFVSRFEGGLINSQAKIDTYNAEMAQHEARKIKALIRMEKRRNTKAEFREMDCSTKTGAMKKLCLLNN